MPSRFDVFLSYNSADRTAVESVAEELRGRQISVWFDKWELRPGIPWQEQAESGLSEASSVAVFVGPKGIGPWEEAEMRASLSRQRTERKLPVIPVALPGMPPEKKLPPFLAENTWVVMHSLEDREAIDRLCWGITGIRPGSVRQPETSAEPIPDADPISEAALDLARAMRSRSSTYFVGRGSLSGIDGLPPGNMGMAKRLLERISLIDRQYEQLLPSLDEACTWYAIKKGPKRLEDDVGDMLFSRASAESSLLHKELGHLLKVFTRRPRARGGQPVSPLVVTTCLDVLLERALLREGLPFIRIVQGVPRRDKAAQIQINHYRPSIREQGGPIELTVDGTSIEIEPNDTDSLDEAIKATQRVQVAASAWSLQESLQTMQPQRPAILYKYLGSQDVSDSCVLSKDQCLELARVAGTHSHAPKEIEGLVGSGASVFLGFSLLDPDFMLLYHTLLHDQFQIPIGLGRPLRFAPLKPPESTRGGSVQPMERRHWKSIAESTQMLGITVLDEDPVPFLRRIRSALDEHAVAGR